MTDTQELIAAVRADRETGTPGPWKLDTYQSKYLSRENKGCHLISGPGWAYFARIWVRLMDTDENTPVGEANARRIARVPDMESAILALAAERDALLAETATLTNSGIIEVAVRNQNVMEYMRHWEGRAERAEAAMVARAALGEEPE